MNSGVVVVGCEGWSIGKECFGVPSEFYAALEQSLDLQTAPPHEQSAAKTFVFQRIKEAAACRKKLGE